MILFGLLAGRWWKTALVAGALGWAVLLLATGVISVSQAPAAMLFGLVNTSVGVAIHQATLRLLRRRRSGRSVSIGATG
jgi:hypothetical protein